MVVFGSKGKGYYPDVTIRKFNNTPAINVIDNEFKLKQSTDLYIYIDLSILSDNEYISELKINLDISNYNKYTGSIRLKSIANYDHKNITLYSPSDKGDINEGYLSASIDNESNVTFNITQIANRQLNNEDKTVKIRLKYYGDGEICITSAYDIVKGKIETKQDILSSFNLNQSTYLLYNNSNGYFHIAKQYKFNYGGINLQNFITLTYNKDQSPMEFSLFSHKLQIDQIGEHKYKYTNELGQVFLYYINDEYFENSKEEKKYICLSLNSSFTIDKDNGIYIVKLNNCTYEVDYNNYNIKKISKGSVCLVYNYDNSQKLVSISKGQTNSNNLTPFITIQNDSIICEYKNKKITIVKSSNGVEKIDEYDIGSNGEVCKNSSLEIVYTLNNINKFIIDEYDEYEVNTDDDNNLLITNLITNQAYTFGINQYYYYINDNYGNIQKYYYNTKNEVIYYVKEKNGLVLDKKCYGYRETDRKEETNLFVKNLFKDIEFNHIFKYSDNYSSEYTENDFVCTNPNMFSGLCNQEFIFNLLSSKKERTIESMINLSGNANEIITLTILSKVDLDEEDEYLKAELEVAYVDNEGFKYKTFTMNCKCLDNEYEFNTMKFVTEKRYISIILKIKYNGNNQCRVSNILINKSKSNDKVIRDDYDRVIGFLEGDTTSKVVYNDMESNDIKEYKDNLGNYYDCSYNEQGELLNYINYSNNDCIIKTYNEDNLLDNECTKVDNYETTKKFVYDESNNLSEETIDDKTNYYFNKVEDNVTINQCINYNGLLTKEINEVNSLSNIKNTITYQLNNCHEKNKLYYQNGVLKQIDAFDDKLYTFNYDTKNRITSIYIDNKLYIDYDYSSIDLNAIKSKKYADNNIIVYVYDSYGRVIEVHNTTLSDVNSLNYSKKIASYEYDELSRVCKICNANEIVQKLEYDDVGNVVKCTTPTHRSSYIYNDDKELVDCKIQKNNSNIVYCSTTVNESFCIDKIFKELTKNVYCDYYFPNKNHISFEDEVLFSLSGDLTNYENEIYFDEHIKRNIILCNNNIIFNEVNFNTPLKRHFTLYNSKIFTYSDYYTNINKRQGALGIFKFDERLYHSRVLFELNNSQLTNLYLLVSPDHEVILMISNINGENEINTGLFIDGINWHIMGIINDCERNQVGIIVNDKIKWINTDGQGYEIFKLHTSKTLNDELTSETYKVAYLMYGAIEITDLQIERIYNNFNDVFNYNDIRYIVSNTYDVFDTTNFDKISLNKNFISYFGIYPHIVSNNDKFNNITDKYFKFDKEINKFCYETSRTINSYLSYNIFYNIDNLLIALKFKFLNEINNYENTIFCIKEDKEIIKITYNHPNINVYTNGLLKTSININMKFNSFNYLKMNILQDNIKLTINNIEYLVSNDINGSNLNNLYLIIGNDDNNNCFEGLLSDVIYGCTTDNTNINIYPTQFINYSDSNGRLRKKTIKTNNNEIDTVYSYYDKTNNNGTKKLNNLVNRIKNHDNSEEIISYDENDNIIKRVLIKDDLVHRIYNYTYDSFNRLIEEVRFEINNQNILVETYKGIYEYDKYGNIINNKKYTNGTLEKNIKLRYQNSSSLILGAVINECDNTSYNVYHNNSAYPSKIGNNNIVYEGNKITQYGNNSYTYNSLGQRISKLTENNILYTYVYDNNKLIREIVDDVEIEYIYNNLLLEGLRYNNEEYYYVRDITGCIEKIIDKDNNVMVSYKYTSYGEVEGKVNSDLPKYKLDIAGDLYLYNSFVYKGYYYDVETGWFWLSSRFYSPELCRFISPDDIEYLDPESVNGLNLYCYCKNNPIMYTDPSGHLAFSVLLGIGIAVGAIIGGSVSVVSQGIENGWDNIDWRVVAVDAVFGAIDGALSVTGMGALASLAINPMLAGAQVFVTDLVTGDLGANTFEQIMVSMAFSMVMVGASSALSKFSPIKVGYDGINNAGIYNTSKGYIATAKSAKKIAMYKAKQSLVKKTILQGTSGYALFTASQNFTSRGLNQLLGW